MHSIVKNPDAVERARLWLQFVDELGPSEIEGVVRACSGKRRGNLRSSEYAILLAAWADQDPYAALDHVENNNGTMHERRTIMATWAKKDPSSAMLWVEQRGQGYGVYPWMFGVIEGIAVNDPQRASQLVKGLPASRQRDQVLDVVISQFAELGPDVARGWAMSFEDEQLQADAIEGVAETLARTDPEGTADWLIANPGEASTDAMDDVMESMTLVDSKAAIDYMESISDPELKSRALEGIANELSAIDPRTTLALIDANPNLVRDEIVRELVWGARTKEPVLGADAIIRIEDERIRNRTYLRYISTWMRADYNAAVDWVNRNELPEATSRSLERMIEIMRDRQN